ncbi:MAG: hypothetical protein P1Q69_03540 [Candidatus Thorarchaeota archaeon]|nr:hypothetical protein [Candidatus Thorarchaeota archaeon]
MAKITVKCVCGEIFEAILAADRLEREFERTSLVPIVIPHKDHFVTVYIDKNHSVRSVERVILVEEDRAPVILSEESNIGEAEQIALGLTKEANPNKEYNKFISLLLDKIKSPETLFRAGEVIGRHMWMNWREAILKMGARYVTSLDLILKSELKPILDRAGKTELIGDTGILITECAGPQFVVGVAQGVLTAVSEATEEKISVKFAYQIEDSSVSLTLIE